MLTSPELSAMRDTVDAALPDTVTIDRPDERNGGSLNDSTGIYTPGASSGIYSGAGRVSTGRPAPFEFETAGTEYTAVTAVLTLPHDAPVIEPGDRVTVDASSDAAVLTRQFRVVTSAANSYNVARRVALRDDEVNPA